MNIVHVEDCFLPTSGYQINFLAKWNKRHGHSVTILTSTSLAPWAKSGFLKNYDIGYYDSEYSKSTGVEIIRIASLGRISGREFVKKSIFKIQKLKEADLIIVHGNDTLTGLRFTLKYKQFKNKLLFDNHMIEEASKNPLKSIFRRMYKSYFSKIINTNKIPVIAVSKDTELFLKKNYFLNEDIIKVIELGSDNSIFYEEKNKKNYFRSKYSIKKDSYVFIYTGKISSDKKVHYLSEVFVKKFEVDVTLIIVGNGSGDYFNNIKNKLKNTQNQVIFIDPKPVTQLCELYNMSDVAIWPGACSLSFYDAQLCSLPVVLESIPINNERLNYNNGFIYEKDSLLSLRNLIEKITFMDKNELNKIGQNGRDIVENKHTYDYIARKFEEAIYSQKN